MTGTTERRWEMRATRRALERHAEADARSGRPNVPEALIAAAQELSRTGDFTVKQVADRANVALQTFYRHFGSKDELILAVLEENIIAGQESIRNAASHYTDPLSRLAAVIQAPLSMPVSDQDPVNYRFQARERTRLSEEYPAEVEGVLSPYRDILIEYISDAAEAGVVFPVDIVRDADMILHLVLTYFYNLVSKAVPYDAADVANYLWDFCLAALLRGGPTERSSGLASGARGSASVSLKDTII
jgi:AcrR family transcriptional regulator